MWVEVSLMDRVQVTEEVMVRDKEMRLREEQQPVVGQVKVPEQVLAQPMDMDPVEVRVARTKVEDRHREVVPSVPLVLEEEEVAEEVKVSELELIPLERVREKEKVLEQV